MELQAYEQNPCFKLLLKDNSTYDVTQDELEIFKQAYPKINIEDELRKMVAWCYSNTSQRKTRKGIKRFINSWLNRAKPEVTSHSMSQREYVASTTIAERVSDISWADGM